MGVAAQQGALGWGWGQVSFLKILHHAPPTLLILYGLSPTMCPEQKKRKTKILSRLGLVAWERGEHLGNSCFLL